MPDELAAQLPVTKQVLDAMGLTRCELAGYEADDLIGTISRRANEHGDSCVVVTGDRDSLQLVGGGTTVRLVSTKMGQTTYETYDTATFREKYGFDPIHLIDLKALMGDSSDNIPGVPGIGRKDRHAAAARLRHGRRRVSAPGRPENQKRRACQTRRRGEQSAKDSYWLATIDRNAPLEVDVENLPAPHMDEDALYDLLTRLEFKNFIKRLGLSGEHAAPRLPAVKPQRIGTAAAAFALLDGLTAADRVFALVPETLGALCLLDGDTASVLFADDLHRRTGTPFCAACSTARSRSCCTTPSPRPRRSSSAASSRRASDLTPASRLT